MGTTNCNLVVAQSGGPTMVINSSLQGIIEAARQTDCIGTVYGARHGIEGVLKEELLDLSAQSREEVSLLRFTPAAGSIGTCRYKLKKGQEEDFERVIDVLRAHQVGYFLYIGGNDSMDTANKIAELARRRGLNLVAVGVPKTIDNDVGDSEFRLIDHTPGYGSAARYWMHAVQNANEENAGSCPADPVLVMQAMGRKIGFIPAAARLADPDREMPLQIYLAEKPCPLEQLADQVNDLLRRRGRAIVVVSEGFDVGDLGDVKDSFGHTNFGATRMSVVQATVNYLNQVGLAAKGAARGNIRRHRPAAFDGLRLAGGPGRGLRRGLQGGRVGRRRPKRIHGDDPAQVPARPTASVTTRSPLAEVANSERTFPAAWIAPSGCDVTDDFLRYARPLVGNDMIGLPIVDGRQRLARFSPVFADQKLPKYLPQADRHV